MAVLKCKMCGGDLNLQDEMTVAECEYCGTKQTVPTADNEKKMTLFARANRLRAACEFDKAAGIYESIVADFPEEAEAYWGLVLCKFGIEYVDDPATGNKIPTCHRSSFESVMDDPDFEQVMENADSVARKVYRTEAKAIEELRKGIIEVSSKEEPYDIFICYKETDENGERTIDSVIAEDIYERLTQNKYRVFFSRISLEDKLGTAYEPYIFAALNSAKIMLAIGTDYDYYNAVWVKNEWSRFLMLMAKDKTKVLIPCYKDLDAYDIPKEFKHLQAQDMSKVGAMQDLLRGIKKILNKEKEQTPSSNNYSDYANTEASKIQALLKRVFIFLEDGDWDSANRYCEKVLDIDPENGEAYLCKFMAHNKISHRDNIKNIPNSIENDGDFKKALRFGDENLINELNEYAEYINKNKLYNEYIRILKSSHNPEQLLETKDKLSELKFKDSDEKSKQSDNASIREKNIITEDTKRCVELNKIINNVKEKEREIALKVSESETLYIGKDERVPTQDALDEAQKQMKELMGKLNSLGAFKKREKEAVSSKIVEIGKNISRLTQTVEIERKELITANSKKKKYIWDEINRLKSEVEETKEKLYHEAIQCEEEKMFDSACVIYEALEKYLDCTERLQNAEHTRMIYRQCK